MDNNSGYGDIYDIAHMNDDELRDLIVQQLREYPNIDVGWIDVAVQEGFVTLSGRVGTDGEIEVAEQVIADVIGIENYSNELVVDELHRGQAPEAADVAATNEEEYEDQLGEEDPDESDTASHLTPDLEAEAYGTHNMQKAIQEGSTYIPPDRPIPEGYRSGENH